MQKRLTKKLVGLKAKLKVQQKHMAAADKARVVAETLATKAQRAAARADDRLTTEMDKHAALTHQITDVEQELQAATSPPSPISDD